MIEEDDKAHMADMANQMGAAILPILKKTKPDCIQKALSLFFVVVADATSKVFIEWSKEQQEKYAFLIINEALIFLDDLPKQEETK